MPKDRMFAQAWASDVDLVALGEATAARKEELKVQFKQTSLPVPTARTLKPVEIDLGEPAAWC